MRPDDARRLHDDPNLKEAFNMLRGRYHKDFEAASDEELVIIRRKFDLIRDVYAELKKVIHKQIGE